jgi:hypothetical protein
MKIHILRQPATQKEVSEMLEELETYIKVAVDLEEGIIAGGGEYYADCEEALLEDGADRRTFGVLTGIQVPVRWHSALSSISAHNTIIAGLKSKPRCCVKGSKSLSVTGKSAGCPAFLPVGRGGEESRPCNHIYVTRKPRPVGGELHLLEGAPT